MTGGGERGEEGLGMRENEGRRENEGTEGGDHGKVFKY